MQDNINKIISNAINVKKDNLIKNIPEIIDKIENAININQELTMVKIQN